MRIAEFYPLLEKYIMSHKGVEKDFKAEWGWTRFMLRGKMFCAFCGEDGDFTLITVKCEPEFNVHIREMYPDSIIEGYYMNKVHWNSVYPDKGVPYELLQNMCDRGYNAVLHSLPKKVQKEITGEQKGTDIMKMKILVVGGGGREHAIIEALSRSPKVDRLFAAPGNGGISKQAVCFSTKATDIEGMLETAKMINPDYVFVAPDDPLVMGLVDRLNEAGFKTFGPRANAAILEGSKVFSKGLMKKYGIPTADYETFTDPDKAIAYIKEKNSYPAVIKCDGLALGKGVIIAEDLAQAEEAVKSMMIDGKFGKSGSEIVVEEYLTGPEVTVLAFTDGKTVKPMVSSMDHKRAYDDDKGLNTGGMGTIAPNPLYTEEKQREAMENIFIPTIKAMRAEGRPFKGCLYFGLMLTPKGVKVIEYNCRFGDPEAQVVLPLLETDLVDIMEAIWEEKLDRLEVKWSDKACACVVMASGGYPEKYETGLEISGLDAIGQTETDTDAYVYHAGTRTENGKFCTIGGRVLGITSTADTLKEALDKAYNAVRTVSFDKAHYRKDIGKKAL